MSNSESVFTASIGNSQYSVQTGKLAQQAGGAVTVQVGESMLFASATMSKSAREGLDFFPLSVEYEEKMYAAGRIPGSFFRREARPSTAAILTARLTDRPLRPLFPKGMRNEVQVIITTLSSDDVYHLDTMAVNAASAGSGTTSAIARPDGSLLTYQPYGKAGLLFADLDGRILYRTLSLDPTSR